MQLHKLTTAGINKRSFILAVLFSTVVSFHIQAQKLIINPVGYKLNEQDTIALNRLVKFEADIYNGLFDSFIPDTLPVVINIYKNRNDFKNAWNEDKETVLPDGFYLPQTRQTYVYKTDNYVSIILHEVSHRFMHYHNYQGVPRWINEGMSEFFDGLYLNDQNNVYVDQQSNRLKRVQNYIKDKKLDLRQYLSWETNLNWNRKEDITFRYDVAYSMIFYIIKTRPNYIKVILSALKQGRNSYAALAAAYGSYEVFEKAFKDYYLYINA